jgi:hypothetical protein
MLTHQLLMDGKEVGLQEALKSRDLAPGNGLPVYGLLERMLNPWAREVRQRYLNLVWPGLTERLPSQACTPTPTSAMGGAPRPEINLNLALLTFAE